MDDEICMRKDLTVDQESELPFYVNLTWDATKNIELQLSNCKL